MFTKNKVKKIIAKIRETSLPETIYLFGSYAAGKTGENSDLDICVIKENFADKQQELVKIKKGLFGFDIPMDILLFNKESFSKRKNIWGSIQYEIFHKGIKVYDR